MKQIVYMAGLPRSGSTLLSNVLAMHPDIHSTPSSPICTTLTVMRRNWSDDGFLLSQLDNNFEDVHDSLKRSTYAFIQAWFEKIDKPLIVDKNRGWLFNLEILRELDPDFKVIITLRDLKEVFTSIEKQHRKTLFIDFPDHMEHNLVNDRASNLFSDPGIIGSILKALQNIQDIPNIAKHLYFWKYEDFMLAPQPVMSHLFKFLGLDDCTIDFENIVQSTHESDSHYRMKYLHKVHTSLKKPDDYNTALISPRIIAEIGTRFKWYYDQYYPIAQTAQPKTTDAGTTMTLEAIEEDKMISQLEAEIKKETTPTQQ